MQPLVQRTLVAGGGAVVVRNDRGFFRVARSATSRVPARRRWPSAGRAGSIALLFTLTACLTAPVPPSPDREVEPRDLVARVPIAAAHVEVELPLADEPWSVVPLRPGLMIRSTLLDGRLQVAWIADIAMAGPQVQLKVASTAVTDVSPTLHSASAYAAFDGDDLGRSIFDWRSGGAEAGTPLEVPAYDHGSGPPPRLEGWFANHVLGDLNADGALDMRDALALLARLRSEGWTDYSLYHSDLDADGVTDATDLRLLVDRVVGVDLPARMHVRPLVLPFVGLDPEDEPGAIVLVANQGTRPFAELMWSAPAGIDARPAGAGIKGRSLALRVSLPTEERRGWLPGHLRISEGNGDAVDVRVGHVVLLVAGQSNAVGYGAPVAPWPEVPSPNVRMLANDYRWRHATEPLDDPTGQIDPISLDTGSQYSFGTALGHRLRAATGFPTYLIPAASGGTRVAEWLPSANPLDRDTLFGSATFRSLVSAALEPHPLGLEAEGGPVSAVVWYQGESDNLASPRRTFVANTRAWRDAIAAQLNAPIVYVQLASQFDEQLNVQSHAVAELQRRMETGSGQAEELQRFHMVVAFDLPRSDRNHLSAVGQRILAERIELAVREHVLGDDVDGTGPRLRGLTWEGKEVRIQTTHVLADRVLDPRLFAVFDGPPIGSLDDLEAGYGDNAVAVTGVSRDALDPTVVRLTLATEPSSSPHVRYMARSLVEPSTRGPSAPEMWDVIELGAIVAADGALPLPVFGPLPAVPTALSTTSWH